jgi:hypothetical protein
MVITMECWYQIPLVIYHGILTLGKVGTAVNYHGILTWSKNTTVF